MDYSSKDFGKVVILTGGYTDERNAALASANDVLAALTRQKIEAQVVEVDAQIAEKLISMKPDRAFILLPGIGGEDGTLQGLLQYLDIPYTGSGVAGCAINIEKTFAKLIWQRTGTLTPRFRLVANIEDAIEAMKEFSLPLCVRPSAAGTGVTIKKINTPEELPGAFEQAISTGGSALIESWIDGSDYQIGIVGNKPLPVIQYQKPPHLFEDDNQERDINLYHCPSNLSADKAQALQEEALRAFQTTGCHSWGRVDFIQDLLGHFWCLKVVTVPLLAEHSPLAKAAELQGFSFDQLVMEILQLTLNA